jgi:hypothetical protein
VQVLREQKNLLVSVPTQLLIQLLVLVAVSKFLLAFFERALDDELVLEFLIRFADARDGVFEDELGVALWGERTDEVELALGELDEGLGGGGGEDVFSD